jgi:hypothetical protein
MILRTRFLHTLLYAAMLLLTLPRHTALAQNWTVTPTLQHAVGDTSQGLDNYADVVNRSTDSATLRIRVVGSIVPPGWFVSLCMSSCYPADSLDVTEDFAPLEKRILHVVWTTNNVPAIGSLTCTLSDNVHPSESYTYTFTASTLQSAIEDTPVPSVLLLQPYPNPFAVSGPSHHVQFRYVIERSSPVALDVVDMLGRGIRRLVDDTQAPGMHGIAWDGRDAEGNPVHPGVYIVSLHAHGVRVSRAVVCTR